MFARTLRDCARCERRHSSAAPTNRSSSRPQSVGVRGAVPRGSQKALLPRKDPSRVNGSSRLNRVAVNPGGCRQRSGGDRDGLRLRQLSGPGFSPRVIYPRCKRLSGREQGSSGRAPTGALPATGPVAAGDFHPERMVSCCFSRGDWPDPLARRVPVPQAFSANAPTAQNECTWPKPTQRSPRPHVPASFCTRPHTPDNA